MTLSTDTLQAARAAKTPQNSPWRLGYHIQPQQGWMNDPNGLCYHQGRYHVFYQHHPDSSKWGPMHWGHVSSSNLIHWEHHPIALYPGEEGTCFSGSAVSLGDELALIYTGHRWLKEDHNDDFMKQVQCLATSKDAIHFEKQGVVIDSPYRADIVHFRDPKVWQQDDTWHMVVGVKEGEQGKVAYYQSDDLKSWRFINTISESSGIEEEGYMWECPDLFSLAGKDILLCSPQGMAPQGYLHRNLFQNGYFVGQFDTQSGHFERGGFTQLDHGHDFYACQTFAAPDGRQIAIGWMDMWESEMPEQDYGRAGALTLPRELTLIDDHIYQAPVKELEQLRQSTHLDLQNIAIDSGYHPLSNVNGMIQSSQYEIELTLDLRQTTPQTNKSKAAAPERSGLWLRCGQTRSGKFDEYTYVGYDMMSDRVFIDRNHNGEGVNGIRYSPKLDLADEILTLRIFVDNSSVEVFIDNGKYTMTSRIYPQADSQGICLVSESGLTHVQSCQIHQLQSSIENF